MSSFVFVIDLSFRDALCDKVIKLRRFVGKEVVVVFQSVAEAAFHRVMHSGAVMLRVGPPSATAVCRVKVGLGEG